MNENSLVPRKSRFSKTKRKLGSYQIMSAILEVGLNSIFPLLNLKMGNKTKEELDKDEEDEDEINESNSSKFDFPSWLGNVAF